LELAEVMVIILDALVRTAPVVMQVRMSVLVLSEVCLTRLRLMYSDERAIRVQPSCPLDGAQPFDRFGARIHRLDERTFLDGRLG
jgi:hypothetical protein